MRCTGCQTVINGLAFESPQGSLCIPCRIWSLQEKKNHPWMAFFTDVVVWLLMLWLVLGTSKALAASPRLDISLKSEAALAMMDNRRKNGGNETSFGDFYINLILNAQHKNMGAILDFVPEGSVINVNDPEKRNYHNQNRVRLDGFLSRPYLLTHLYYKPKLANKEVKLAFRVGAMKFLGLQPLFQATDYHAVQLTPLVLSTQYDKGMRLDLNYSSWLDIQLGFIDGDWKFGEADVFAHHDSRANSAPGATVKTIVNYKGLELELNYMDNRVGSNPGQKTYLNNQLVAIKYTFSPVAIRIFKGSMERGVTWGPSLQPQWPAETTSFHGGELLLTGISYDLYLGLSEMKHTSGEAADIWIEGSKYEKQWVLGGCWKNPTGIENMSLTIAFSDRRLDNAQAWGITDSSEYVFFLGVKFVFNTQP